MTSPSVALAPEENNKASLKKELGLFDVYAICTGAMFSSGFFLLPGLAAAQTGPSVALAYLLAGILMLPAMFSMAELSTAMPRAGGDYYFLDRAMGPLVGTIGGTGTYLALTLKSAFALIGMGAYLSLFLELNIQFVAVALTIAFALLNIFGAKETTGLQRVLVIVLVSVMAVYIVGGIANVFGEGSIASQPGSFTPFFTAGIAGLLGTVGFVFVSYAGLTKIASVAEEIKNPGRNIPLGMILSIVSTTIIYVVGVIVMTIVLPIDDFQSSLTPVADAARTTMSWLPGNVGIILIVVSATAAFASTGNAGILAASRYPLAMGRDHLLPGAFASINPRTSTPVFSIVFTAALMIFAILALDESAIAKVASAFQLLIFMLVNLAVIVMRESKIEFYDPIYRTPLYPYMQIAGIGASIFLLSYIGADALGLTVGVMAFTLLWFYLYAYKRVERYGAIFHWFAQLGEKRYEGLEDELHTILREKGLREEDPFSEVITRATVVDLPDNKKWLDVVAEATNLFTHKSPMLDSDRIASDFISSINNTYVLVPQGAVIPNLRLKDVNHTEIVIIRSKSGVLMDHDGNELTDKERIHAFFFVISPEEQAGQHLRIIAELINHIETDDFAHTWAIANDEQEIKEILLHSERLLTLWITPEGRTAPLVNTALRDLRFPEGTLIALIRRNNNVLIPRGSTILEAGDRVTIIGEEEDIQWLFEEYVSEHTSAEPV
ncbi:MAG: amino acid permease [Chloroflexota bacterium]